MQKKRRPDSPPSAGLFVRLPVSHARLLDRAAATVPARKKDIIAALLARYVNPDTPEGVAALREMTAPGSLAPRVVLEPHHSRLEVGQHSFLPNPPREVLDAQEAGELLAVPTAIVIGLAESGEIPGRKIGGQWRFARQGLLDWLSRAEPGRFALERSGADRGS